MSVKQNSEVIGAKIPKMCSKALRALFKRSKALKFIDD